MFDRTVGEAVGEIVGELAGMVDRLAEVPSAVGDDGDRIDVIVELEKLKAAVAAAQLGVIDEFAASQEASNRALGVEERAARRGVPEQVGLARKVAPATAARQVSQARALRQDLPETYRLLCCGEVSEWVATIVATETSHLTAEDRRLVDKQLAAELAELSPARARARAKALGYEVDPRGTVTRRSNARKDRRVGMRPAPDTMAMLSALVPCEQGVAAWAALRRHADSVVGSGDGRSRDQIMADTLVERLTGQTSADAVDAEIGLVMTDQALFGGADEPAELGGYGPIPAEIAREIVRRAGSDKEVGRAKAWLRRLFTDPNTGIVADVDPRRRRFDGVLARLLVYRDRTCRDPFCDAPIRHLDHIEAAAAGGLTTSVNGRGLCERGNYVRHMPGWKITLVDPDRHIVETTTPTGHRYRSRPPPAPGATRGT